MRHLLLISTAAIFLPLAAMAQTIAGSSSSPDKTSPTHNAAAPATAANPSSTNDNGKAAPAGHAASNKPAGPPHQNPKVNGQDKHFVKQALPIGMSQLQEGRLALHKGDDKVEHVGTRMVADDTKMIDALRTLAESQGVPVPHAVARRKSAQLQNLRGMSKGKFQQKYLMDQQKAQHQMIELFTKEARSGGDPKLKSFAAMTLKKLQTNQHLIKSVLKQEA